MTDDSLFRLAEADKLELAGGKAYALGKLLRAGFNVPDGFVVSAEMFKTMTPPVAQQILEAFDELAADLVAVRSSAINEDGTDAAWAGQLDTFLNCNRDNLLENIEQCRASTESARARSYAEQKAISSTKVAVIVQTMIPSEVSGVAFSVHPVSNDAGQVVIEAGLGLGEAVVSGQITPDTYVVDKNTGQPLEKHRSHQTRQLVRGASGATTWVEVGAEGHNQKLTDEQIVALCSLTAKLEAFFRYPIDMEWAVSNGTIYILQSRPITTLKGP